MTMITMTTTTTTTTTVMYRRYMYYYAVWKVEKQGRRRKEEDDKKTRGRREGGREEGRAEGSTSKDERCDDEWCYILTRKGRKKAREAEQVYKQERANQMCKARERERENVYTRKMPTRRVSAQSQLGPFS
jgi:hypothetical protein